MRAAAWSAAVAAVGLQHGSFSFEDWSGKTAGLALATTLMQLLPAAVKRLERSETRLRAVLDHSADVITIVDRDSRVSWLSNPARVELAYELEDARAVSTVHGIVSSLGGYVSMDSEPGAGTTVSLHLPGRRARVPATAAA